MLQYTFTIIIIFPWSLSEWLCCIRYQGRHKSKVIDKFHVICNVLGGFICFPIYFHVRFFSIFNKRKLHLYPFYTIIVISIDTCFKLLIMTFTSIFAGQMINFSFCSVSSIFLTKCFITYLTFCSTFLWF